MSKKNQFLSWREPELKGYYYGSAAKKFLSQIKCPYRIKSYYDLPSVKVPNLCPAHTVDIIYVDDYDVDYIVDFL